jgi:hypothetical protein
VYTFRRPLRIATINNGVQHCATKLNNALHLFVTTIDYKTSNVKIIIFCDRHLISTGPLIIGSIKALSSSP